MRTWNRIVWITLLSMLPMSQARTQSRDIAPEVGKLIERAIQIMDSGRYEESRVLLMKAHALDTGNLAISYEIGLSHYLEKDYGKALEFFLPLLDREQAIDQFYQSAGNAFDLKGDPDRAIETYRAGLKRFPKSGGLHLELGNMEFAAKKYVQAMALYEKGIEVDPMFPSNYFRAAWLYGTSPELVWGILYGEVLMNLERGSPRSAEMSTFLFDFYRHGIYVSRSARDSSQFGVRFSKRANVIDADALLRHIEKGTDGPPPSLLNFEHAFEGTMSLAVAEASLANAGACATQDTALPYECICAIRSTFIKRWFETGQQRKFPNALFAWQKRMADDGVLDAYNHWLLGNGDIDAFKAWVSTHREDLGRLIEWVTANPFRIDENNPVARTAYLGTGTEK